MQLTTYTSYADAQEHFSSAGLWDLFDGDRQRLNIAHECIDRHADGEAVTAAGAAGSSRPSVTGTRPRPGLR